MSFDLKIEQGLLSIDTNGDFRKVENTAKLVQEILKICISPLNGNPFDPGYGSLLSKTLIGNPLPMDFLVSSASNQLSGCLQYLQKLQKEQLNYQPVSAAEQLAALQQIKIERNQEDPRFFEVVIKCLSRDLTTISPTFLVDPL